MASDLGRMSLIAKFFYLWDADFSESYAEPVAVLLLGTGTQTNDFHLRIRSRELVFWL